MPLTQTQKVNFNPPVTTNWNFLGGEGGGGAVTLPAYYRKLTLHDIKVLEIKATLINANLVGKDFPIKDINAKEKVTFQNKGN